jgi:hypothetical protein
MGASAAVHGPLKNLAGKNLGATTTRLGALSCYNVGNLAVDWLGGRVRSRSRSLHGSDVANSDGLGEMQFYKLLGEKLRKKVLEERIECL